MEAKGGVVYHGKGLFDVLVLTLMNLRLDWEELRLMEESMGLSRTF